ncbi:prorelaxin H1 [Genypterus blacodes]|uniref:prorelaxin H1 n=1 Tax=Genypterus blacodes TaxID=154954 RepID=UPI003F759297
MLCKTVVAVAAVCVGAMCCSSAQADALGRALLPRDYRVKLCGREFIRAVIFTCGGSRWRRAESDPLQWSSFSDVSEQDNLYVWQQEGTERTDRSSPVQIPSYVSLSDLLALFGIFSDRKQPLSEPAEKLYQPAASELQAGSWPEPSRKKRNFSLGMAGMCCDQGCTKNDIGRLC